MDEMDRASAPKIKLGNKEWPVPELAAKRIMKLVPLMRKMGDVKWEQLSEADMQVMYDIGYIAITQGTPNLTREEFDEMPIKLPQLIAAIPIIGKQAGIEPPEDGAPGEASAESPSK